MSLIKHLLTEISSGKQKALEKRLTDKYIKFIKDSNINKIKRFYEYINKKSDTLGLSIKNSIEKYFVNSFSDFLEVILEIDPTDNKKYGNWLIDNIFEKNQFNNYFMFDSHSINVIIKQIKEDTPKIKRNLKIFDLLKDRNILSGNEADINSYDFRSLYTLVKPYLNDLDYMGTRKENIMRDTDIIYEQNGWQVVVPKTYESSCFWGTGTDWCTAVNDGDDRTFKSYTDDSPLFIIKETKNKGRKFQYYMHYNDLQFMNEDDRPALDEFKSSVSIDTFRNILGTIEFYTSEMYPNNNIIEFLYNLDVSCDIYSKEINSNMKWINFLSKDELNIIKDIYENIYEELKDQEKYWNGYHMHGDTIEHFNRYYNHLPELISNIRSSASIDFIDKYDNKDNLRTKLEKEVFNRYKNY